MKKEFLDKVCEVIEGFPKAKNGPPFLTLLNGRKMFFNRFLKKYGIYGEKTDYNERDLVRRLRLIEFFDFFTKEFPITKVEVQGSQKRYIIESNFHRMVLIDVRVGNANKLELLSFYPL